MDPLKYLTARSTCPGQRQADLFLRRKMSMCKDLYSKDLVGHFGCVNALEFSHGLGNFLASGGDDRRVLLWDIEKAISEIGKPRVMKGEHNSNIFCLAFDVTNCTLFSGGNDEQVIVHDLATGVTKDVFLHDDAVYGLSPDPVNPHVFASSCDDGRVLIYDIRDSSGDPFCLANYTSSMHSVMYNPVEPRLLATANAKEGVGLWDVRKPRSCVLRYGGSLVQQSCMSVRFNQHGDQIIALRRRLPPVLYKLHSHIPVCEFDHSGYYNSCTMKSVAFAGDQDQYVISGSDEFNLYMWAVPEDLSERVYVNSAHMVLKGHRSIVNQVRFNPSNHLIVSSGVEKIIKAWSPFKFPNKQTNEGSNGKMVRNRPVYSHEEYINLVLETGHVMSHDYSHRSTEEDPRMIAFFDSLVQRELEGLSSDDSLSSNEEELYSRIVQLSQSDIDSDDSLLGTMDNITETEPNFSPFTIAFASVMASQAAEGNDRYPRLNSAIGSRERRTSSTNVGNSNTGDPTSTNTERDRASCDISKLVLKKKLELRHSIQRKIKDCPTKLSDISSAESTDVSELELSDNDENSLTIKLSEKEEIEPEIDNSLSETSKYLLEKLQERKRQSQVKLRRLKNLRKSVLNSDSDDDDLESNNKIQPVECVTYKPASVNNKSNETVEKVTFKKFKRRNSDSVGREDRNKSRASPDLGPYLQRTGTVPSTSETRKGIDESYSKKGKKYLPEESLTGKGRVKQSCHRITDSKESNCKHTERCFKRGSKYGDSLSKSDEEMSSHRSCNTRGATISNNVSDEEQNRNTSKGNRNTVKRARHLKRHRSLSPCFNSGVSNTDKRAFEDAENIEHSWKYRKFEYSERNSPVKENNKASKSTNRTDNEKPSCSYKVDQDRSKAESKTSITPPHHTSTSDSEDDLKVSGRRSERENTDTNDQPTWSEFRRFKNRLERARHRYKDYKKGKTQRRYSDDR